MTDRTDAFRRSLGFPISDVLIAERHAAMLVTEQAARPPATGRLAERRGPRTCGEGQAGMLPRTPNARAAGGTKGDAPGSDGAGMPSAKAISRPSWLRILTFTRSPALSTIDGAVPRTFIELYALKIQHIAEAQHESSRTEATLSQHNLVGDIDMPQSWSSLGPIQN